MAGTYTYPPGAAHPSMAANDAPKVDYSNLPCPIPYEELHREANNSLKPELFEGMRFSFAKMLSPKFTLIYNASMEAAEIPTAHSQIIKIPTAQYEFCTHFADPKSYLIGSLMGDGRLNANAKFDLTENLTLNGNGQFTNEQGMSHHALGSLNYKGRDWRAQFQMGTGGLFGANYIQSVTPNLSLGGEAFWSGEQRKSGVGYAARYSTDKMVATAQVASTGMVTLTYVQKLFEMISVATDFTYNYLTRESVASVGYDFTVGQQSRVRGKIDSEGRVSAFMEEALGGGLKLILSGEIDHKRKDHKCGVGLNFVG